MTDELDLLRGAKVSKPDAQARARALEAGLAEFDTVRTKGSAAARRPKGIATLWSDLMHRLNTATSPNAIAAVLVVGLAVPTAVLVMRDDPSMPQIELGQSTDDVAEVTSRPDAPDAQLHQGPLIVDREAVTQAPAPAEPEATPAPRMAVPETAPNVLRRAQESEGIELRATPSVQAIRPSENGLVLLPHPTETYANDVSAGRLSVLEDPISTFSIDVDTASYARLRRELEAGRMPPPEMVRTEEVVNAFDYAYPAPDSRDTPFRATATLTDSPFTPGARLLHIGIKGYDLPPEARPPANLVFLVDMSGSMDAPDKLPLLVRSLRLLLAELRPQDRVAIVGYAGAAGTILPSTPASDRQAIEAALDGLMAGGGTAGAAGIEAAYALAEEAFIEDGANRVILATDGDFNVGTSSPDALEDLIAEKRETGIGLTVLGFGTGNLRDDTMQALAQAGDGIAAYIDTLSEARHVLGLEAQGALYTIASDVKLQVEFNPAAIAEYRLLGYETRALATRDFDDDRVDAGEIGAGHEVTAIYELYPEEDRPLRYGEAATVEAADAPEELGYLQIRHKRPGEDESRLIATPIRLAEAVPFAQTSDDLRFSVAAAGFAERLRGTETGRETDWEALEALARAALGDDPDGRRRQLADLIDLAGALDR
ncbi:MAG: von Willebrand factor type A domain-containing protein [Pseudomonadota bacterium]